MEKFTVKLCTFGYVPICSFTVRAKTAADARLQVLPLMYVWPRGADELLYIHICDERGKTIM